MRNILFFLLFFCSEFCYSQWVGCSNGLTDSTITGLAICGNNLFAATYSAGVFMSTNNGNSWTEKNNGLSNLYIQAIAAYGNNIYLGTAYGTGSGIYHSSDNGNNWNLLKANDTLWVYSIAANDSLIIAGTNLYLCLSTDSGNNWSEQDSMEYIKSIFIDGNNIYLGYDGLFLSTNVGLTWLPFDSFNDFRITSILKENNTIYVGTVGKKWLAPKYGGVYISTDNGSSWAYKFSEESDSSAFVYALAKSENKIFAAPSDGVIFSLNNGNTWSKRESGMDSIYPYVGSLLILGDYIFAGTYGGVYHSGSGVYRALLSDFTSVFDNQIKPEYFLYPNPTSSFTQIRYISPDVSVTNFTVTDLFGSKVKEISERSNYKEGEQVYKIDTSDLASGIYFVTMESGGQVITKQLLVVK